MLKDFLTKHRGLVIFLFAVPFSFVFQKLQDFQNWFYRNFLATHKLHDKKVQKICKEVQQANADGKLMCTARATWKTMSLRKATYKSDCIQIPIELRNILSIDRDKKVVRVEPMVTMGDITHFLIPKGFALAVQVEMDDLTVGGLCMGIGIETSSHKYGFLFETIRAYEIVTAEGNLVRATKHENSELFRALPMSHGTLGFLVAVELDIIAVKKYMKVKYQACHSRTEFCQLIASEAQGDDPPSFLEGLMFSASSGVVMTGEFSEKPKKGGVVNSINRWYKPWFYTHVKTLLSKKEAEEYIPLRHYFHRHTPSVFFQLKVLIPFANSWWYRCFFAWLGAPKISLMKYSMTKDLRKKAFANRVTQDIVIPMRHLDNALEITHEYFGIYPLWICPVRLFNHGKLEGIVRNPTSDKQSEMYVDIGIYGIPPFVQESNWNSLETGRKFEKFTLNHEGFHMLYADIFMNKKEFEAMFPHELYRLVRSRYGAENAFPEIYTKVIPESWLIDLDAVEHKKEATESLT